MIIEHRLWDSMWEKSTLPTVRKQFLRKLCNHVRHGLILDQGCGTAQTDVALAKLVDEGIIVSSDFSLSGLRIAKWRSRQEGVCLNLVRCDVCHLPFRIEVFDSVFCEEVLEHVYDAEALLAETRRVLKMGGPFVISVPNSLSPFYAAWRKLLAFRGKWIYGDEHPYAYWNIKRLLRRHGFADEEGFYFEMPRLLRLFDSYKNPLCVRLGMVSIKINCHEAEETNDRE